MSDTNETINFFAKQLHNNPTGNQIRRTVIGGVDGNGDEVSADEKIAFLLSELSLSQNAEYRRYIEQIYTAINYFVSIGDCEEISALISHLLTVGGNAYETHINNGGTPMASAHNEWFNDLDEFSALSVKERREALNYINNRSR